MVGAVREELGLQAHRLPGLVDCAPLARHGPIQEIAGVELDAGLLCPHLHHNAGPVAGEPGAPAQPLGGVQDEVVVIAAHVAQLLVIGVYVPAQGLLGGEVEGCARHGPGHGRGDAVRSHGGVAAGGQPEAVAHHVAAAVEVEVAVVGDVAVGVLVAGGLVADGEVRS